jgi:release factor glutamine methyltransferase
MITVSEALRAAMAMGLERLDAQWLLLHALKHPQGDRAWLVAHDNDALEPDLQGHYMDLVRRRAEGAPLAYLTGQREFYGLTLQVDARVLDPRPDTETLVDWALLVLPTLGEADAGTRAVRIIDLGTGSGAIALALKHSQADAQVTALDASAEALAVARANAQRLGLDLRLLQGNWLENVNEHFDLIVSNPPYIAEGDPHLDKLGHEPRQALTSGTDGLDDIRVIIAQARAHLQPGGWLLLEHGWDQAQAVRALMVHAGFEKVQSRRDLSGMERCSGARAPRC